MFKPLLTLQLVHAPAPGPSQVAQDASQLAHIPLVLALVVAYSSDAQPDAHLLPTSIGLIHGGGLHDAHVVGLAALQSSQS